MNIALYGGSFDPPHIGHVSVVKEALKTLDIDKLIIIPAFKNPLKYQTHASTNERLGWLREIFKDYDKVEISDFEISKNRSVYTIESVEYFSSLGDKIYLIIGADNIASLDKWYEIDRLNTLVTWVVAARDGIKIDGDYIILDTHIAKSSSDFRASLDDLGLDTHIQNKILKYYRGKNVR